MKWLLFLSSFLYVSFSTTYSFSQTNIKYDVSGSFSPQNSSYFTSFQSPVTSLLPDGSKTYFTYLHQRPGGYPLQPYYYGGQYYGLTGIGGIGRINYDGFVDTGFNKVGYDSAVSVSAIVLNAAKKVLLVGATPSLIRYNVNGTKDITFGTNGYDSTINNSKIVVQTVVLDTIEKIIIAGSDGTNFWVARYNKNGGIDNTFGTGGKTTINFGVGVKAFVRWIKYNATSGKILLLGSITKTSDTTLQCGIGQCLLNSNGNIDVSFGGGTGKINTYLYTISNPYGTYDSTYNLLTGGYKSQSTGKMVFSTKYGAVRLKSDGSLDASFGVNGYYTSGYLPYCYGNCTYSQGFNSLLVDNSDNIILLGDRFYQQIPYYPSIYNLIKKLDPDGANGIDSSIVLGADWTGVTSGYLLPDGKFLTGGCNPTIARFTNNDLGIQQIDVSQFCTGTTFKLGVSSNTTFNVGNVFTIQLSDSTGSFSNPVNIGSKTTSTLDSISVTIPSNVHGNQFRLRVTSSNPSMIGSVANLNYSYNGQNGNTALEIRSVYNPSINISTTYNIVGTCTPTVSINAKSYATGNNPIYVWKRNNMVVSSSSNASYYGATYSGDTIQALLTSSLACASASNIPSNKVVLSTLYRDINVSNNTGNNICAGTPVIFGIKYGACFNNQATNFTYQWKKNGLNVIGATNSIYNANSLTNGDKVKVIVSYQYPYSYDSSGVKYRTVTDSSAYDTIFIKSSIPTSVSIDTTISANTCVGQNIKVFVNDSTGSGGNATYTWKVNGTVVGGNQSVYSGPLLYNGDSISVAMTSSFGCASPLKSISNSILLSGIYQTLTIGTNTGNTICKGTSVTFTSTNSNQCYWPNTITYIWKKNGSIITSATASSITLNNLVEGDKIRLFISFTSYDSVSGKVHYDSSNSIIIHNASKIVPSISINSNTVGAMYNCSQSGVLVSITDTTGSGGNGIFNWYVNGVLKVANSSYYPTYNNRLFNGDSIKAVMTSSFNCASPNPASSNIIVISGLTQSIMISDSLNHKVCNGGSITMYSSKGGCLLWSSYNVNYYQWKKNGIVISGANADSVKLNGLKDGDIIRLFIKYRAVWDSTGLGVDDSSNIIKVIVGTSATASINVSTNNSAVCYGSKVVFNSSIVAGGSSPQYLWKKNGNNVSVISAYTDSLLNNGDSVWCLLTSNATCLTGNSQVKSNVIKMTIKNNIGGLVKTPFNGYLIPTVKTILKGTVNDSITSKGNFTFSCLLPTGNYIVKNKKNNDVTKTNGVSTIDVALIQSHILGKVKLSSPYKIIASDVNGDNKVSALDIVYIKRLILGLDTTFTGNRLWAFVDSSYHFPDTTNPFPYKDSITFTGLSANKTNQTFIGMKLGDVNWDWNPAIAKPGILDNKPITLWYDDINYSSTELAAKGNKIHIPIKVKDFKNVLGLQFTLHFNPDVFSFNSIENSIKGMDYASNHSNEGQISFIFLDEKNVLKTLADGSSIFDLVLIAKTNTIHEVLDINSEITNIETWDGDYNKHDIVINKSAIIANEIITKEYWDISPNPTTDGIIHIQMNLKEHKTIIFHLVDVAGKVILNKKVIGEKGANSFTLRSQSHLPDGVYYLKADGIEGVKQLIIDN